MTSIAQTNHIALRMAIVQSGINGNWSYCPEYARELLKLEYDDESPYQTAQACIEAAKADPHVPKDACFTEYPLMAFAGQERLVPAPRASADRLPDVLPELDVSVCDDHESPDGKVVSLYVQHYVGTPPARAERTVVATLTIPGALVQKLIAGLSEPREGAEVLKEAARL